MGHRPGTRGPRPDNGGDREERENGAQSSLGKQEGSSAYLWPALQLSPQPQVAFTLLGCSSPQLLAAAEDSAPLLEGLHRQ